VNQALSKEEEEEEDVSQGDTMPSSFEFVH